MIAFSTRDFLIPGTVLVSRHRVSFQTLCESQTPCDVNLNSAYPPAVPRMGSPTIFAPVRCIDILLTLTDAFAPPAYARLPPPTSRHSRNALMRATSRASYRPSKVDFDGETAASS